jgi:hypothetical protein
MGISHYANAIDAETLGFGAMVCTLRIQDARCKPTVLWYGESGPQVTSANS